MKLIVFKGTISDLVNSDKACSYLVDFADDFNPVRVATTAPLQDYPTCLPTI